MGESSSASNWNWLSKQKEGIDMKQRGVGKQRREFLKKAGLGSMALAASGVLSHMQTRSAQAAGQINFHFLALSAAQIVDGVHHQIIMAGHGGITPGNVVGNGSFQHQDADPGKPAPQPILGEGTWKAKKLVSFEINGTYGVGISGVLTMEVDLVPVSGPVIPAMLEVVCNIPPAGLFTGKPEGYSLTIPGAPFGTFNPLGPPPLGITWFTNTVEPAG